MSKRTTLTLDDDVAAKLDAESRRTGRSFKETVNSCLRQALTRSVRQAAVEPFKIEARDLKPRPGLDFDNIEEILDQVEGPDRR